MNREKEEFRLACVIPGCHSILDKNLRTFCSNLAKIINFQRTISYKYFQSDNQCIDTRAADDASFAFLVLFIFSVKVGF